MISTTIHIILVAIVLIGALNWGFHTFGYNLVEILNRFLSGVFKRRLSVDRVIYVVVALSAVVLAFKRDTWLPFLGESVLPGAVVPLKKNLGDTTVDVKVQPGAKVAYWAAKPLTDVDSAANSDTDVDVAVNGAAKAVNGAAKAVNGAAKAVNGAAKAVNGAAKAVPSVKAAYDNFENSGVVVANDQGNAILVFNKGTSYIVPGGKEIKSHVHYREFSENGMMGPIQSVFV